MDVQTAMLRQVRDAIDSIEAGLIQPTAKPETRKPLPAAAPPETRKEPAKGVPSTARRMIKVLDTDPPIRMSWPVLCGYLGIKARGGNFNAARKWPKDHGKVIESNNLVQIAAPSSQAPTPRERYLTVDEIHHLLGAASAPHIKLALQLLLGTAGRVGAVLELTLDRIDFERGVINLRKPSAATRKGRSIVPMNGGLRASLATAKEAVLSDYVVGYSGKKVGSTRKGFDNAVQRAGLSDVTIHTLRHRAAVHLDSNSVPIEKVAQYLGHSNAAITYQTHAPYAPEHLTEAADILDFLRISGVS